MDRHQLCEAGMPMYIRHHTKLNHVYLANEHIILQLQHYLILQ